MPATVTLLRSDSSSGPFEPVPDGSGIMSVANQNNPDTTDAEGRFGWDVLAGYYVVRAEMADCVSPTDPLQSFVESAVLTIPPPVTDLDLRLNCALCPDGADCGDDNVDGQVSMVDAMLTAQYVAGLIEADDLNLTAADVNCSGEATMVDAMLVAQKVAGLIGDFSCTP